MLKEDFRATHMQYIFTFIVDSEYLKIKICLKWNSENTNQKKSILSREKKVDLTPYRHYQQRTVSLSLERALFDIFYLENLSESRNINVTYLNVNFLKIYYLFHQTRFL